ncbi:helix-turn-helix domain-containing protein [Pseudomonas sp. TNT11]|uniref:Helix-turn-helix domain-containing protein n=1 Tax=Pseudomonas emilianonis TaxID=2915812 RepID=A0ABT0ECL0_9PSED|nr:helix-turn-helix domain-containing protein [Pseudomonas emilianonis]MCK1783455.1 helix-turn-helix domain-containing protein [Pseudomonas emilianonis]
MTDKQPTDWERIEQLYRAGVLSVREIAATCGVSHTAINKRAKAGGWDRNLKAKIHAKADALVSKAEVSTKVSTETLATERGIVEANAQVIADIRLAHRTDIGRGRRLANKLLDELEGLTDNRDLFEQLGELLRSEDDNGQDKRNDLYMKVIDLPARTKTMKELGETLKNLITLERQAYDLGSDGASPSDAPSSATSDDPIEAARIYQKLMSGG